MFTFKEARHQLKSGVQMIEVWNGGIFMGSIYPTERGIRVISKYLGEDPKTAIKVDNLPPVPAILVNLVRDR